jgi:predicted short-subunit dehydrogenase-like oxidoreductase (DUF2520 family)
MLKIGFIGAGTVGTALAILLSRQGYRVAGVSSLSPASATKLAKQVAGCRALKDNQAVADSTDLIFITTPDDAIATVASQVKWHKGQGVVHCSGADAAGILEPARLSGADTGSFHPLQAFSDVREAMKNMPGTTFAIEAGEPLLGVLKGMATAIGGQWLELKAEDKTAYHAAAVIASNYLVTLVKMATDLWQTFGIPPDRAKSALLPLLRGTLHNIETIGLPACLTGPIARGDSGTITKHLQTLQEKAPALLPTYRELALQTVPIALAKGKISKKQAAELEEML